MGVQQFTDGTEKGEKEPPLQKVDPECFRDALKTFFQPAKTNDPRLDFYTMYKRESAEHDTDHVEKYDEDLNTTLIFAGLFSAVSSAFVIDVHSNLQPNPNDQSVALLRAILLTLNQSAIPSGSPTALPAQQGPTSEIITVTGLLYASLSISLLAAFIAMLAKQWLNRYMRHAGGSMIERCGDRQRKCVGLEKWPFRFFVESLPVMLQIALLLLACGLCRYMASINNTVAGVLISFTVLGVVFYLGIIIAGATSYECPFQTPVSTILRNSWLKTKPYLTPAALLIVAGLRSLGEIVQCQILRIIFNFPHVNIRHRCRVLLERIQSGILRLALRLPWTGLTIRRRLRHPPLPTVQECLRSPISHQVIPWSTRRDLDTNQIANDVRCVSWILKNITDQEALDTAIRLASAVRWFEEGTDKEPPYHFIVSTFDACFGSDGKVHPGSRDRAYNCGRAILWIHTLAMCQPEERASMFLLPTAEYAAPDSDPDLGHLLSVNVPLSTNDLFVSLLSTDSECTPSHKQWMSNVLLHVSWANRTPLNFQEILWLGSGTLSSDVMHNRLLAWCILLGSPVEEEALKVQDKSDLLKRILRELSKAIISAINSVKPQHKPIQDVLFDLARLENRPHFVAEMAYEWCSAICGNYKRLEGERILPWALNAGFRHHDSWEWSIPAKFSHTEHHRELIDIIFKGGDDKGIADLLQAWTSISYGPAYTSLGLCTEHLVDLPNRMDLSSSSRLRQVVIRSVETIDYEGFKEVGTKRFAELLNNLHVGVEDMNDYSRWTSILLGTIRSSEGARHLSVQSWELLVELTIRDPWEFLDPACNPQVMASLLEGQEWDKLECWMGIVWMARPPQTDTATEDVERATALLFRQRPGAVQKLTEWMERRSTWGNWVVPEAFRRICDQLRETASRLGTPPSLPPDGGIGESPRFSPPRNETFWESLPFI